MAQGLTQTTQVAGSRLVSGYMPATQSATHIWLPELMFKYGKDEELSQRVQKVALSTHYRQLESQAAHSKVELSL